MARRVRGVCLSERVRAFCARKTHHRQKLTKLDKFLIKYLVTQRSPNIPFQSNQRHPADDMLVRADRYGEQSPNGSTFRRAKRLDGTREPTNQSSASGGSFAYLRVGANGFLPSSESERKMTAMKIRDGDTRSRGGRDEEAQSREIT